MDWTDERYVRLYVRDTAEWIMLSWEARALFHEVLRKVDRAGVLALGRSGTAGLAALTRMPPDVVARALDELAADGCVELLPERLVLPNFLEAQEARQGDAQRARESRARRRDVARDASQRDVVAQPIAGRGVTPCDSAELPNDLEGESRAVTDRHTASHEVTLNCAVPNHLLPTTREGGAPSGPHPMPADLPLRDLDRAFAEMHDASDVEAEWAKFVAHYQASGALAVDWYAAWKKWVVNAAKYQRRDRERERDRAASRGVAAARSGRMKQPAFVARGNVPPAQRGDGDASTFNPEAP